MLWLSIFRSRYFDRQSGVARDGAQGVWGYPPTPPIQITNQKRSVLEFGPKRSASVAKKQTTGQGGATDDPLAPTAMVVDGQDGATSRSTTGATLTPWPTNVSTSMQGRIKSSGAPFATQCVAHECAKRTSYIGWGSRGALKRPWPRRKFLDIARFHVKN
jgi:hypothetical protein